MNHSANFLSIVFMVEQFPATTQQGHSKIERNLNMDRKKGETSNGMMNFRQKKGCILKAIRLSVLVRISKDCILFI